LESEVEDQEAYRRARRRVDAKIGFFIHAVVYVIINALLVAINLSTSPGYLWFFWPLGGWGLGLFFHALSVFLFVEGSAMKQRMIDHELERQRNRK
jgi:hypothetical protein